MRRWSRAGSRTRTGSSSAASITSSMSCPATRARWSAGASGSDRTASSCCCKRPSPRPSGARRSNLKPRAGQRRHHGAAQGDRPSHRRGSTTRPRDPGPPAKRHGLPLRQSYARLARRRCGRPAATPMPARCGAPARDQALEDLPRPGVPRRPAQVEPGPRSPSSSPRR